MKTQETQVCYLLYSGGFYKIGKAKNLNARFWQISPKLPTEVVVAHVHRVPNAAYVEHLWHRYFAEKRVRGEWFRLSAEDVALFQNHKSPPTQCDENEGKRNEMATLDVNKYLPKSKWLKADTLLEDGKDRCIVTVQDYEEVSFEATDEKAAEDKLTIRFQEFEAPMVLNATNLKYCIQTWGSDPDEWIGKRATLAVTVVNFRGKNVNSLALMDAPKAKPKPVLATAAPAVRKPAPQEEAAEDDIDWNG